MQEIQKLKKKFVILKFLLILNFILLIITLSLLINLYQNEQKIDKKSPSIDIKFSDENNNTKFNPKIRIDSYDKIDWIYKI